VVLTGEGADELLGGYHWHKGDALLRPLLRLPAVLRRLAAAAPTPASVAARRVLGRGAADAAARYQHWLEVESGGFRQRLLSAAAGHELSRYNGADNPLLADWAERLGGLKTKSVLHQMLWLETQTRLVDFINFEVDKMSMAHSIEARVPFLDHRLWEFCAGLPAGYKLRRGLDKYLLRRATRRILPEATAARRKKGLAAPYADWLRAPQLPGWAETVLGRDALVRAGLFDPATVAELRRAHQAGQPQLGPLLMGVLSTQVWVDCFGVRDWGSGAGD
jgi:asparagine synthase (glutamine-hydrolysing)